MTYQTEVVIMAKGQKPYKAMMNNETIAWTNTNHRFNLMKRLKQKNIKYPSNMSTDAMRKLLNRHKDKTYEKQIMPIYKEIGTLQLCDVCHKEYKTRHYLQRYCSKECSYRGQIKTRTERILKDMVKNE